MADFLAVYNVKGEMAFLTDRRTGPPIEYRRIKSVLEVCFSSNIAVFEERADDSRWRSLRPEQLESGPVKDLLSGDKPEVVSERYGVEVEVRKH